MLTQEKLKELLHYDPFTGIFTRKIKQKHTAFKVGATSGCIARGYVIIRIYNKTYQAHRLVWLYVYGKNPIELIDHINTIRNDNCLCNLREATRTENAQNQVKAVAGNKSGYLGVSWNKKSSKYIAQITVNGEKKGLGFFADPKIAYQAYLKAKRELHPFCTL